MPDFVPAQLLPGLQSYRGGLLQGQADPTQGLCQDTRGPAGGAGRSIIRGQLLGCPGILRARRLPSCGSITMKYAVGLLNALQLLCGEYAYITLALGPERLPYGPTAEWLSSLMQSTAVPILFFVLLLFPTGRLLSSRWRIVAWAGVCAASVGITSSALVSGPVEPASPFHNPFGVDAAIFGQLSTATLWLFFAATLGALVSLVVRFVRSRGEERQQITWFVATVVFGTSLLVSVTAL